ncbi:MAG: PAS domain S-box protein [Syntrophales bacterium]
MQDKYKTKQQLIEEVSSLRAQLELKTGGGEDRLRSEASLIIPKEHYAMIFDQFPLGISVIRKDGFMIYVNPAFVKLTGYTLPDIDKEKKWFQKAYPDKECRRKALYSWVKYQTQQLSTEKVFQVTCKDGKSKSIEFNMITVADGTVISMLTNVTGCGKAVESLREREDQWRLLLDTMNEGFITVNEFGVPVFVNQRFCDLTGYTQQELIGRPVSAFLDPENLGIFQSEFSQRSSGRLSPYEIVFRHKDGRLIYFLMSPRPLYDSSGRFAGSFGTCMDITERKIMEEELRRSEQRYHDLADDYRTVVENATDGIYRSIPAGRYLMSNQAFARILGYESPEELLSAVTDIGKQVYADPKVRMHYMPQLLANGNGEFETELRRKDGELIWILNSVRVVRDDKGQIQYFEGIAKDISERKRIEDALRKSEERYRMIVENTNDAIYIHDFEGNIIEVNDNACLMVGYERDELVGAKLAKIDADWRAPVNVDLDVLLMDDKNVFERENIRKDGSVVPVEVSVKVISREGKGIVNGFVRDISERKRAEDALEESRKRYQDLIESINEIIWEIDATARFTYISPSIEKLTGYEQREVIGKLPYEFAFFEEREKLKGRFHDSFDTHDSFDAVTGIIVHKRGARVAVEVSGNPFYDKEGKFGGYRGILRDISEIKKLHEEMIKSQKLESIGVLAGGIAHDFNNLLMGILGYIGLAKLNARQEMVVERSLAKAEESCMRAKELAQRLLTFSRGGDPQMNPIDIRAVVRESVKLALRGSNIQCRYYLAKHLHTVRADEEQIRQAIGNIIINAMEASPAGGAISVKGENVHYRRKDEKPFIKVTISDRGKGIANEYLKKIFDPYFTTKDMGALKGTGLGLSISYSIIKKHGGDITVQSEVGKGTSVSIYLPADGDIMQAKSAGEEDPPVAGPPEASAKRILVMDDEALIRSFLEETMSFLGYDVTTCDEGSKAVEMYREAMASRPYDLVVLDLTVPGGLGGQEAIQRLLDVDPAVTAIICSGYTDDPVISHCGAYGFKGALVKPASIGQIRNTLNSIFNK